jgi:PilZ domain
VSESFTPTGGCPMKKKSNETIPENAQVADRRDIQRIDLSAPLKVTFQMEHSGELMNISKDGLAIRFPPVESIEINTGKKLRLHVDMNGRVVSIHGEVKRITEKDGDIVLGLEYDRNEIALFNIT